MKQFLRLFAGMVFVVSGFVKAVDTVGFSFKLEEYFSAGVFNLPFLEPLSLPLAIIISLTEVLLGLMLVFNFKVRVAVGSLIVLCVFFAFLTFYSAYFNVVTDCGCFGDAVKLTPWQSFFKDIILLIILLFLWYSYRNFNRNSAPNRGKIFAMAALFIGVLGIAAVGIRSEPVIDFRDYKIGTDLNAEKAKLESEPAVYQVIYQLKNRKTGENREVAQDDYLQNGHYWKPGTPWAIDTSGTRSVLVKEGYNSEISKFKIEDASGSDITRRILAARNVVLIFSYQPSALDKTTVRQLEDKLADLPVVYGVSTAYHTFTKIPNATMDGTAIKTIARSNPFILVLQQGKIVGKMTSKEFLNSKYIH